MKISGPLPTGSLALVVVAAGVVTVSPEFALDAVSEFTPLRLSDALLSLGSVAATRW